MNKEDSNDGPAIRQGLEHIIKETKELVKYGEWFIGFENMLTNLNEIEIKVSKQHLILIKEIFEAANIDWREEWNWIENLEEERN